MQFQNRATKLEMESNSHHCLIGKLRFSFGPEPPSDSRAARTCCACTVKRKNGSAFSPKCEASYLSFCETYDPLASFGVLSWTVGVRVDVLYLVSPAVVRKCQDVVHLVPPMKGCRHDCISLPQDMTLDRQHKDCFSNGPQPARKRGSVSHSTYRRIRWFAKGPLVTQSAMTHSYYASKTNTAA